MKYESHSYVYSNLLSFLYASITAIATECLVSWHGPSCAGVSSPGSESAWSYLYLLSCYTSAQSF